jgi:hypothetical protein
MSEHVFSENEIEAIAFLFLTNIRKMRKAPLVKERSGNSIFSELENYLYLDVIGGYPVSYIPSDIVDVIPKLGIEEDEAMLFASYLGYCLLRRSDEHAVKMGLEPKNELDLLVQFRKEKQAFKIREEKLGPTILSQNIVEILKRDFAKKNVV